MSEPEPDHFHACLWGALISTIVLFSFIFRGLLADVEVLQAQVETLTAEVEPAEVP